MEIHPLKTTQDSGSPGESNVCRVLPAHILEFPKMVGEEECSV